MPPAFSVELKEYSESQDHLVAGTPEPNSCPQTLIYHFEDRQWWIKVTFLGTLFQTDETEPIHKIAKRERRKEYQEFANLINYRTLPLLDDTVSELLLEKYQKPPTPSISTLKLETVPIDWWKPRKACHTECRKTRHE